MAGFLGTFPTPSLELRITISMEAVMTVTCQLMVDGQMFSGPDPTFVVCPQAGDLINYNGAGGIKTAKVLWAEHTAANVVQNVNVPIVTLIVHQT
jgi:hypothetical protein